MTHPDPPVQRISGREVIVAVLVSFCLTAVWLAVLPLVSRSGGDTRHYLRMAADPEGVGVVPFAYRVLTPWFAHAIGGADHFRGVFRLITDMALTTAGPAVYLICRRLGGTHMAALAGVAGLLSLPGWLFNLYVPYLIDPTAMSLTAWSMTALVYGWFAVLPLLLTALGLARETVAGFALPMYMWLRSRWVDWHVGMQVALLISPALLAAWIVRQPLRTRGWNSAGEMLRGALHNTYTNRILDDLAWWSLYAFAASLGIWWVLGLCGRKHGGRLWWLLVPVFAQCVFGSDWSRFALYAFPVVVPAGAIAVWHHPRRLLLLGLIAAQSLAVFADLAVSGRIVLNRPQPSVWISTGLAVAAAVVLWWPRRRRDSPNVAYAAPPRPDINDQENAPV